MNEGPTIRSLGETLRRTERSIRTIVDEVESTATRAAALAKSRDALDSAIHQTAQEITAAVLARDQSKLTELSARLAIQVTNRATLGQQIEQGNAASVVAALASLSPTASACIMLAPIVAEVLSSASELSPSTARRLFESCSKLKI
jgi:hypothetical protein